MFKFGGVIIIPILAGLTLLAPAAVIPTDAPAARADIRPAAVVGTVTVMVNGKTVGPLPIQDGRTHLFGELGFEVYLVLSPGAVTLELDPPSLPFLPPPSPVRVPLTGGGKRFMGSADVGPLHLRVTVDLN